MISQHSVFCLSLSFKEFTVDLQIGSTLIELVNDPSLRWEDNSRYNTKSSQQARLEVAIHHMKLNRNGYKICHYGSQFELYKYETAERQYLS